MFHQSFLADEHLPARARDEQEAVALNKQIRIVNLQLGLTGAAEAEECSQKCNNRFGWLCRKYQDISLAVMQHFLLWVDTLLTSKKQLAEYSGRAKDADSFISSLIFVKGWLIGPRSRDSSFFNYKKLLLPCRKSTVNIKSKFFIALFYLYLFALQKFLRQPNQKILLIFYIPPKMDKI